MGWNVPDDWGCYYRRCSRCGSKYHASEGGCGCIDLIDPCQCGDCNWEFNSWDEDPTCRNCGTGPHKEGSTKRAAHRARKPYPKLYGVSQDEIRPGDLYLREVHFGYFPGGAGTLKVSRRRIEKGPAWGEEQGERTMARVCVGYKRNPETQRFEPTYV